MKTLPCDLCEATAEGEKFEEWMKALHPHYADAHAEIIRNSEHGKADMEKWMRENKARFDAASYVYMVETEVIARFIYISLCIQ